MSFDDSSAGHDAAREAALETCAWCEQPAAEQVLMGAHLTETGALAEFSWLCDRCATDTDRERQGRG